MTLKRIVVVRGGGVRSPLVLGLGLLGAVATTTPAAADAGGAFASEPASIRAIACVGACAGLDAARPGSLLRVRGRSMRRVRRIIFLGGRGHADNATARVVKARSRSVDVLVPAKASTGRLRAVNADGARSRPSRATIAIQRGASSGGPLDVRVVGRRVYVDAVRRARVDLLVRRPMNVTVGLVRVGDGALVSGWPLGTVPAGVARRVTWDGTVGGAPQPPGRYEFRVYATAEGGQAAQAGTPLATGAFDLVDHKFPIRGTHGYGGFAASFGGGRGHQGQDVFADCGTPLVAARGGVVKQNTFQSRAGNYIVIDGAATDVDYAYMHLRDPSPLTKGARVHTGQVIGHVGETGRAHGCHLHFEMWSGPGWYTGGSPFDPLPFLKAWDAYS